MSFDKILCFRLHYTYHKIVNNDKHRYEQEEEKQSS